MAAAATVSVVIPVFNGAAVLRRAIDSVVAQSRSDWQLIVVDDASTDDTGAHIDGLRDPRLHVIRHDQNRGAAAARNSGVDAAEGRYVAFLDADDEWLPEKLARQVAFLNACANDIAACGTGFDIVDAGARKSYPGEVRYADDSYGRLLRGCDISPGATLMVRTDRFREIGPFDTAYPRLEDWDWLLRCAGRYRIAMIADVLARVHRSAPPASERVRAGLARLEETHMACVREHGAGAVRAFRAALALEAAAIDHREGRTLAAAGRTLAALARVGFADRILLRRVARIAAPHGA